MPLEDIQTGTVKKKIFFIFIIFALALVLSYIISNAAFKDMLLRVHKMTSPNDKIVLVNQISQEIMLLDRMQREQILSNSDLNDINHRNHSLKEALNLLRLEFANEPMQIQRVDSIQNLIDFRDDQFQAYLLAKKKLDTNPLVKKEIEALGQLIDREPSLKEDKVKDAKDIAVVPSTSKNDDSKRKGFWKWLLGDKNKEEVDEPMPSLVSDAPQSSAESNSENSDHDIQPKLLDKAIQRIQEGQAQSINNLITKDIELLETGNVLYKQIIDILQIVEQDALKQADLDNIEAKKAVKHSVDRIILVFIIFLLVIGIMIYFILSDIHKSNTYRLALEEAKEVAEYHAVAKQRFLSNMSHELRTPLQSIIGFSEQLKNRYQDDNMVKTIQQSSEHLLYIVNEVLDFNRIDSGKIVLKEQPLNLQETIQDVIHSIQSLAHQKSLKLEYRINLEDHLWILGDAFRIRQILYNLLSNAIKFTQEGKVTLDVSGSIFSNSISGEDSIEKKLHVQIKVKDTGVGIGQDDLVRIFEHFEQVEHSTNSPQQGSGLGLSIVKGIVETMGGEVFVQSEKSKGSVFTANFPVKVYHSPSSEVQATKNFKLVNSEIGKVWVVDDDRLIRELCQTIFEQRKIPYKIFSTPQSILREPYDSEVKTILLDIRMPQMNGFLLNKELRKSIDPDKTSLIAFTAQALPEEQSQILSRGFDGILLKPFREMDLLHVLGFSAKNKDNFNSFDSEQQNPHILNLLILETEQDVELLRNYFLEKNTDSLSLVFHRLAGRISQFGGDKLTLFLRKMEIDTRADEMPTTESFENIIIEIKEFLKYVQIPRSHSR